MNPHLIDLERLSDPFDPEDLEWRIGSKSNNRASALCYVTNRAVQQRFDDVCGPENWTVEFAPGPIGGVSARIGIRLPKDPNDETAGTEWVYKADGADATNIEAVKGGYSGAQKRAAVQWGVGRYLYSFPDQWLPLNEAGKYFAVDPVVENAFLPQYVNMDTVQQMVNEACQHYDPIEVRRVFSASADRHKRITVGGMNVIMSRLPLPLGPSQEGLQGRLAAKEDSHE